MSRDRFPLIDALRCLASVAVVWHHVRASYLFGAAVGVPVFLVLMVVLVARGSRSAPLADYARSKAQRLLVPWLRWSLVYVALAVVTELARGHGPTAGLEPRMLFYGGHGALWFLPYAFVVVLVARAARGALARVPAPALVALAVAASWAIERWHLAAPLGMPFGAWLRAAPALPWGLAVARVSMESEGHGHVRALALVAGAATVAVLLAPESTGGEEPLLRFALAVPLVCLGFAWRPRVPRAVHDLSTLTFGVYVVHPSLAKAFATAFEVARWPGALHVAAVWLCSAAAVLALRRLPVKLTECWSGRAPAPVLAMPRREERRAA